MHPLRKLIREIVDEELTEVSTSAAAPGYQSPHAFRGNSAAGIKKAKKNAEQAGYKIVGKIDEHGEK
jgi:hypothetical protein